MGKTAKPKKPRVRDVTPKGGRPMGKNREAIIADLQKKPCELSALAAKYKRPERSIRRYLEALRKAGHDVVRRGNGLQTPFTWQILGKGGAKTIAPARKSA